MCQINYESITVTRKIRQLNYETGYFSLNLNFNDKNHFKSRKERRKKGSSQR